MVADYTEAQVKEILRKEASRLGSMSALAPKLGVTVAAVSDILNGRRGVSGSVAAKFGFKRFIVFRKAA